jgi:hypothetical protein
MSHQNKIPEFLKMATDLKKEASRYAAVESVKFFKESFVKGGFTDTSFTAWKKSKTPLSGKRTLFKSGKLMRSIRNTVATVDHIVDESQLDYSEIHNDGGYIIVTTQMKKFFWAKYNELGKKGAKANFCKAMALKKTGSKIKIDKRQFIGESKTMMNMFDTFWRGRVDIVFKQHLND